MDFFNLGLVLPLLLLPIMATDFNQEKQLKAKGVLKHKITKVNRLATGGGGGGGDGGLGEVVMVVDVEEEEEVSVGVVVYGGGGGRGSSGKGGGDSGGRTNPSVGVIPVVTGGGYTISCQHALNRTTTVSYLVLTMLVSLLLSQVQGISLSLDAWVALFSFHFWLTRISCISL